MPSIANLKTAFQDQIAPGDDAGFLRIVQEADTRLLEMGRWRWCRTRTTLTPASGLVTLDSDHAAILGIQINDYPADIRSEEYEFVPDGVGDIEVGSGGTMLIDQGLTDAGLRHYKVTGYLDPTWTLNALVLYAPAILYDPDIGDSGVSEDAVTTTRCTSAAALKLACLGVIYEENHDLSASAGYFQRAMEVLDSQEQNQRGNARQQVNVRPAGRGVRGVRSFR